MTNCMTLPITMQAHAHIKVPMAHKPITKEKHRVKRGGNSSRVHLR